MPPKNCDTMKPDCNPACFCQTNVSCLKAVIFDDSSTNTKHGNKLMSSCHQAVTMKSTNCQKFQNYHQEKHFSGLRRRKCWDDESCDFQNVDQCQHTFARFNSERPSRQDCLNPMSTVQCTVCNAQCAYILLWINWHKFILIFRKYKTKYFCMEHFPL